MSICRRCREAKATVEQGFCKPCSKEQQEELHEYARAVDVVHNSARALHDLAAFNDAEEIRTRVDRARNALQVIALRAHWAEVENG